MVFRKTSRRLQALFLQSSMSARWLERYSPGYVRSKSFQPCYSLTLISLFSCSRLARSSKNYLSRLRWSMRRYVLTDYPTSLRFLTLPRNDCYKYSPNAKCLHWWEISPFVLFDVCVDCGPSISDRNRTSPFSRNNCRSLQYFLLRREHTGDFRSLWDVAKFVRKLNLETASLASNGLPWYSLPVHLLLPRISTMACW